MHATCCRNQITMHATTKHQQVKIESDKFASRGSARSFVIVELVISFSLSGVLIVVCYFWMHAENPYTVPKQNKQYCIPCSSISLNVDEDIENFRDLSFQQGNYLQCCAGENKLPSIVELSVEKHIRKKIASGFISGVPPSCAVLDHQMVSKGSAKVLGFTTSITGYTAQNSYLTILNWDTETSSSFVGSDVEYRNGSFVIGRSAYYTVYSQITFNQNPQRDDEDEFKTFVHLIYKHIDDTDYKYDLKLLESSKSLCQPKITDCTGTSHISSVFFLRKSDEITVRVNDPRRIVSSPMGNFFGIFPVS